MHLVYSYDRGNTYNFHLGVGEVIKGMDMGMKGMCKGEKRKITIPPELGYGNSDIGTSITCTTTTTREMPAIASPDCKLQKLL